MAKRMRGWDEDYEPTTSRTKGRVRKRGGKRRAAVDDLRDLAADLEIAGYQRMEVDDLIRAIRDHM